MTNESNQLGVYRLEQMLGQGGMAVVYRAWNTNLRRHEAVKVLPPHMAHDREFVERFLGEAQLSAGLHHPHIATIYTVSEPSSSQAYFAMELVEGEDLAHLLARRKHLSLQECVPILRQMASALDYAHSKGIVHRDIKPANVLLAGGSDGAPSVKLVDFGIGYARDGGARRITKTGVAVGTPEYMSPEQGEGRREIDYRTDIYSLGVVMYELLCGRPPFPSENVSAIHVIISHVREQPKPPAEFAPWLPPAANAAILTALAKNPAERFQSCAAFADALEAAIPKPERPAPATSGVPVSPEQVRPPTMPAVLPLPIVPPHPPVYDIPIVRKDRRPRQPVAHILIPLCLVLAGGGLIGGWVCGFTGRKRRRPIRRLSRSKRDRQRRRKPPLRWNPRH